MLLSDPVHIFYFQFNRKIVILLVFILLVILRLFLKKCNDFLPETTRSIKMIAYSAIFTKFYIEQISMYLLESGSKEI